MMIVVGEGHVFRMVGLYIGQFRYILDVVWENNQFREMIPRANTGLAS